MNNKQIIATDKQAIATNKPLTTSYSFWSDFRNCRMKAKLRYIDKLVPVDREDDRLTFGTLIHECLYIWHTTHNFQYVTEWIDRSAIKAINKDSNNIDNIKHFSSLAKSMINGYSNNYPATNEPFEVVNLEVPFFGSILHPSTNEPNPYFALAGVIDGIVREKKTGEYYIIEHKTTSSITGDYLDRLDTNTQVILYSIYAKQVYNIDIAGVIYNILEKTKAARDEGETEEEYQAKYAAACAKNKNGKSSLKRKMPETEEEFQQRLNDIYSDKSKFHRVSLYFSSDKIAKMKSDLWEWTKNLYHCLKTDTWYDNNSFCFQWGSPCPYWDYCSSDYNEAIVDSLYQIDDKDHRRKNEDKKREINRFISEMNDKK